jgi:hypothetical protein
MDPLLQWAVGWYTKLRLDPAWADYALQQVQSMAKDFPWLYGPLPGLVQAEVDKHRVARRTPQRSPA